MQNTISKRPMILFIAAIIISVALGACSDDNPSAPGDESNFDFSGDLIVFQSLRDGQEELYLTTSVRFGNRNLPALENFDFNQ